MIEENQLPALQGSEKQIQWARDVRHKAVAWLNAALSAIEAGTWRPNPHCSGDYILSYLLDITQRNATNPPGPIMKLFFNEVLAQPELAQASWWIARRYRSDEPHYVPPHEGFIACYDNEVMDRVRASFMDAYRREKAQVRAAYEAQ